MLMFAYLRCLTTLGARYIKSMRYIEFRIVLSKGWTLIVCSVSVVVLALMGSCRSKKVNKTDEPLPDEAEPAEEVVDEYVSTRSVHTQTPVLVLPSDSKNVKDMIEQVNELKQELSDRMNSIIYGTPEVMQRRADENNVLRHKIDSLDNEIKKARQK